MSAVLPVSARRASRQARWQLLLAALLSLALLAPVAAVNAPKVSEASARVFGRTIEWFAPVQLQSRCDPRPKPGTVKLSRWLQTTYKGSGSLGITRACKAGGISEHKEGRAFDWKLNVHNRKQRAEANAFLTLILKTDNYGNKAAIARRMGIMYVIWNSRIWSTSQPTRWRAYHGASEHTDHMHISLSWNGALGRTSFWSGLVVDPTPLPALPTPKPTPKPAPVVPKATITPKPAVPSTPVARNPAPAPGASTGPAVARPAPAATQAPAPSAQPSSEPAPVWPPLLDQDTTPAYGLDVPATGEPVSTPFSLRSGKSYRLVVSGTYRYGSGSQLADATCNWHPYDDAGWSRRSTWEQTGTTHLDLLVDDRSEWRTRGGSSAGCDSSRTYVWDYRPLTTGPVTFTLNDDYAGDNSGSLHVTVLRSGSLPDAYVVPSPALSGQPEADPTPLTDGPTAYSEQVSVPATGEPVHSVSVLRAGVSYVLSAQGTVDFGEGESDAACVRRGQSATWQRTASVDPLHSSTDMLDLWADGTKPWLTPVGATVGNCAPTTHTYRWTYVPTVDERLRLQVYDPDAADNSGALVVTIARSTSVPTPTADPVALTTGTALSDETVTVPADATAPVRTTGVLSAGETYAVTVSGTYDTGYGAADAECASRGAPARWDNDVSVWNEARPADLFDLFIDASDPTLTTDDPVDGCSAASHVWHGTYTARRTGVVRLGVWDVDATDNTGSLTVRITRLPASGATPTPTPTA